MNKDDTNLNERIFLYNPGDVIAEMKHIVSRMTEDFDHGFFDRAFRDMVDLFNGNYPGYSGCSTKYHSVHKNIDYLKSLISSCKDDYECYLQNLRRGGIAEKILS